MLCSLSQILVLLFLSTLRITSAEILTRAKGCADVLNYFQTNALKRVGPYGFSPFPPFFGPPAFNSPTVFVSAVPQQAAITAAPETPPQAGIDFSETNVQVEGVDEPDIVKTDGTRVFTLRGTKFFVVGGTNNGTAGRITGNITLPTAGIEMLIHEDRVLVISRGFGNLKAKSSLSPSSKTSFFYARVNLLTVIYQISVAGPQPKLLAILRMEGRYISSREVDGIGRIILKFDPTGRLPFVYGRRRIPIEGGNVDESTKINREVIRNSTINTWLPRYYLRTDCSSSGCGRENLGFISDCDDVFLPTGSFNGFGLLTVATLQLFGKIKPRNSVSIVSDSGDVYSTASSLYVATTEYRYDFSANSFLLGASFKTSLHKFRLGSKGARYLASGTVLGSVLNQFSMHEHAKVFYVATTEGAAWWTSRDTSKSKVTAFRRRNQKLEQVGEVGNLGVGERIFAVRYIEKTAYVVTFRQIDPLYIIDLSNPRKLNVTGELKIPGFSSYLHPIDTGRILGVGQEATLGGRTTRAKVSLFDVSDVYNPRELAGWTLNGSFTSAQFDHRAFLFWKPESVAVLPVSVSSRSTAGRFVGSVVLNISDDRITERGRITHKQCSRSFSGASIERNFVLERTHLWSLSRDLLQVNSIKDLAFESNICF